MLASGGAAFTGCSKAARKSGKDDYDKFSLPMGSSFIEDTLKVMEFRFSRRAAAGACSRVPLS